MPKAEGKIPITVVTGFLGAGKTTLVNHILKTEHGMRIAIIENEFGEVGIDDALVVETKEEIYEASNGCICCTVRGDLIRIMGKLLKKKNKFDAILIETTGLANPAPVIQTFFVDEDIKDACVLDAVLTVVDTKHVMQHLDEEKPEGVVNEAVQQVAFADKILLNKVDLVTDSEKREVVKRLRHINRTVEIIECTNSSVDLKRILAISAFSLDKLLEKDPEFLEDEPNPKKHHHHDHSHKHDHNHDHDHHHHDHDHEHKHGEEGHECDEHCEQNEAHHCDEQCDHDHDHDHDGHGHHHHKHDDRVTSVGIQMEGECDMAKLNDWLSRLVQERGQDLFRTKGILAVKGSSDKHVFQGVHMLLQFSSSADGHGRPWQEGEKRINKLVFIGKKLNRQELTDAFKACLAA